MKQTQTTHPRQAFVIISSDVKGIEPNATLVWSLLSNYPAGIHVRLFSRDIPPRVIRLGRLTIEVICTPEDLRLEGRVPAHVNAGGTFDRIAAIPYCSDWNQAVILDYDQVVIGDPSALFETDLGDALVAGRLWPGRCLGDACREWFGRELPEQWGDCRDYRYFYMGPVLNLTELRKSRAYDRFLEFHAEANMEEQIALHVACRDRLVELPAELNAVPQWDGISSSTKILHFTGPAKPWKDPGLVGAPYWRRHETTWEDLTCGLWTTFRIKCLHLIANPHKAVERGVRDAEEISIGQLRTFRTASVQRMAMESGIELFAWDEAIAHLEECSRVLDQGGELYLHVIDLKDNAAALGSGDARSAVRVWDEVLRSEARGFLHTRKSITLALQDAGFLPEEIREESTVANGFPRTFSMVARKSTRDREPMARAIAAVRSSVLRMRLLEIGGWNIEEKCRLARLWMKGPDDRWTAIFRSHPDPSALEEGIARFSDSWRDLDGRTEVLDGDPVEILAWLLTRDDGWEAFDAIILHASRRSDEFLTEACMAWRLLRPGGTMLVVPVAREPGPVGRLLYEQGLESFLRAMGDSIVTRSGKHEVVLVKAGRPPGSGLEAEGEMR